MRRALTVLLALLLAALLGAGWYAYQKGFTRKWRTYVSSEFRKRGVEMSLRQLALDPFRGLVARDVKIYDSRGRRRTVAVIDEILLVINYANFFKGKPFIEALDLRQARLALPLDPAAPRGPAFAVRNLSGRLLLPPQQIYLSRLDADLYGVRVSATGRLINPGAFKNKALNWPLAAVAGRLIEELHALKFENEAPQLDLRFSGDLKALEKVFIEARLSARKVRRGEGRLGALVIDAALREGVVELKECAASDKKGVLAASGRWEMGTGQTRLHLRSTLNAASILNALGYFKKELAQFSGEKSPLLEVSLNGRMGEAASWRAVAHVGLGAFRWGPVHFESLGADGSWADGQWSVRDVHLVHRSGELTGDAMSLPEDFRARFRSTLDVQALAPLFPGKLSEALGQLDFVSPPVLSVDLSGPAPENCRGPVRLQSGRATFRNVGLERLSAEGIYEPGKLTIEPLRIERLEGAVSGKVTVDFLRQQVVLEKVEAHVQPAEVMLWFAPALVKAVASYRFPEEPPTITLDGIIDWHEPAQTLLRAQISAPAGMQCAFLKRTVLLRPFAAQLELRDKALTFPEIHAEVFGGKLQGEAEVIHNGRLTRNGKFTFENFDFAALLKLYLKEEPTRGRLDGRFEMSSSGEDARSLRGHGEVSLREGRFLAVPIFSPVANLLATVAPGLALESARTATASFSLAEGAVSTRDLLVEFNNLSLQGHGRLWFVEDALDFHLRLDSLHLPAGAIPANRALELVGDEKLSKPRWRFHSVR